MQSAALISAVFLLGITAGACSGDDDSSPVATTAPAPTSPFEIFVTEDRVVVGLQEGIYDPDGALLVRYTAEERACISAVSSGTPGLAGAAIVPPGTFPDPEMEQIVAEVVVGCVAIDRFADVVVEQLAPQPALEGVDRVCLEREVRSLQDTPDVLAAVLRGDENGIPAVAGAAAANCA